MMLRASRQRSGEAIVWGRLLACKYAPWVTFTQTVTPNSEFSCQNLPLKNPTKRAFFTVLSYCQNNAPHTASHEIKAKKEVVLRYELDLTLNWFPLHKYEINFS